MAPAKDRFEPKPIKLTHSGEAAFKRPFKPKERKDGDERWSFKPKKRLPDGPRARALRLFYVQHSAKEKEIRDWLRSSVDADVNITMFRRDKTRPEFIYIFLEKVAMATALKKRLEYVNAPFVLDESTASGQRLVNHKWGGLRIDYVSEQEALGDADITSFWRK